MSQNILKVAFWKLAGRFSIIFILVISMLLTGMSYIENGSFEGITTSLDDGSWKKYTLNRVVLAIVYGAAMAFFSRRKARKTENR